MFPSEITTNPRTPARSGLITALDLFVAFATLESYGVVDGRDDSGLNRRSASDRSAAAARRAATRRACQGLPVAAAPADVAIGRGRSHEHC